MKKKLPVAAMAPTRRPTATQSTTAPASNALAVNGANWLMTFTDARGRFGNTVPHHRTWLLLVG